MLVCGLQLGLRNQTVLILNERGDNVGMFHTEIEKLPETICGYYYNHGEDEIYLNGPSIMCHKVADDIKDVSLALYADKEPIKVIVVERG
jgi:hypothetical protein